jgi:hypothetical protein
MQRRLTTQDITWFLDINGLGRLDLEPAYQRRSVWTRRDRQFFLDTIFNNYPSPAVFLHKDLDEFANATYHVVDGKQRLETILMFVQNELPIRDNYGDIRLNGIKWKDLSDNMELKKRFLDYQITVEMLDSIEPTVVNEVFGRLNQNSRKLTPQEVRHARFDGWFINRAEQETENPLWKTLKVSTPGRYRRMQDAQYVSELMAVLLERQVIGFDQMALDELYAKYDHPEDLDNPLDTEEFDARFEALKEFLRRVEDNGAAVTRNAPNLAHFYSLWAWIALCPDLPEPDKFAEAYGKFMETVQSYGSGQDDATRDSGILEVVAQQYVEASRGATTDLSPRAIRFEALSAGLAHLLNT